MTCASCQNKIEKKLNSSAGVEKATVSFEKSRAIAIYDPSIISRSEIEGIIRALGYRIASESANPDYRRIAGLLIAAIAAYMIISRIGAAGALGFPMAEAGMGYGMLFVIGLLTSAHCVAMCGGINLSQCIPQAGGAEGGIAALKPSFLYNAGRALSYSIIGGVVGAIGSVFGVSASFKGAVQIIAGMFMIVMGLSMMGIFPSLRKLVPRMPKFAAKRVQAERRRSGNAFYIGMLNGLMPCGPLQAMQLYALSSGSAAAGALSMLFFSLGTIPLMFGLGALSSIISQKFTAKMMTAGSVLVAAMGLSMLTSGWSLSGFSAFPAKPALASEAQAEEPQIEIEDGVQYVKSSISSGRYEPVTVYAGIPVKWTLTAPQGSLNGCNNRIVIPAYKLEVALRTGDNLIEFTPLEAGTIPFSCWMGMIRSSIRAIEYDLSEQAALPAAPVKKEPDLDRKEIKAAELVGEIQRVSVEVDGCSFSPSILVIERGKKFVITFEVNNLNGCGEAVYFPAYGGGLDLNLDRQTPELNASEDFFFTCGMDSQFGYVKVVDNIDDLDYDEILREVSAFEPDFSFLGCCAPAPQ
jgi:sulfite exporter TauE/SafE/plastocyanin domain-containing protein/copper chaperone CopZ